MGNGIIIYQNLLAFLLRSCGESGGLSVMPPDVLDPLNQSLQELSKTMRSDPVSALIHSAEHRARLLQIAERLALKYTSQLQEQLHLDGEQMARHVVDLVDSADNKAAVLSLRDEEAQRFLDAVDDILSNSSISHTDAWRIQRLMLKLSESSGKLPLALFVRNISHCDRYFRERGGFGEVYQASLNGRTVALKRLSTSLTANIEDQRRAQVLPAKRFCREVFTWRRLRHKFVLPLMGVDRDTFPPFLAMVSPWMEHGTALDYSRKNGIGSVDRLLFEIAQGLSYLHSMNIVHGDLRGVRVSLLDHDLGLN
ncbi:Kinase-like protein [Mycena sanguinolenta]|uniref:Kinase-like protein n=1 Tax=Mycena sanguinolenta TaxID=230812 RepID=A0A8H6ZFS5_9AGAR|nr:Kinase-like protein [Mycena sanguinolenta]